MRDKKCRQKQSGATKMNTLSKKQRKQHEQCRIEIVCFDSKDVLTASGDNLGGWKDSWYPFEPNYTEGGN